MVDLRLRLRSRRRAQPGLLLNYDSGTAYSLEAADFPLTAQQAALNPGYAGDPTDDNHIFFGERGARLFGGATTADLAAVYSLPIYKRLEVWVKGEVRNLLNDDSLIGFDTTIQPDTDGPVDSLGLPLDFVEGPNFGEGDSRPTRRSSGVPLLGRRSLLSRAI